MLCPRCKNMPLKATKLDGGLLASGCVKCNGALVSLLFYRDWAERAGNHLVPNTCTIDEEISDTKTAVTCPKCSRLMRKYRISGTTANTLDLCTSCDEAWLDNGEWQLLQALSLSLQVPEIFSESWQTQVKKDALQVARNERLLKIIGEENMQKAEQTRAWLKDNPHRTDILFYLNHS